MKVLTEADLRAARVSPETGCWHVPQDTFVTPAAREYLQDRKVTLVFDAHAPMHRVPLRSQDGRPYVDGETEERLAEKPEDMTHLRGGVLVRKTHPRIALRGGLDSLQARVLLLQADCGGVLRGDLDSVLAYIRAILGAEVKDEPLGETELLGLSHSELRRQSHDVRGTFGMDHPIPDVSMGRTALELNLLRTQAREVELMAAQCFPEGERLDIIQHLNRLSSGVYILFCREISGYYQRNGGESNG